MQVTFLIAVIKYTVKEKESRRREGFASHTVMSEKTWHQKSKAAGRIEFTGSQEGESSKARVAFPTSPNLI